MKSRSDEIGIKSDSKDIKLLHNLLTEPDEVWEDLVGYDILNNCQRHMRQILPRLFLLQKLTVYQIRMENGMTIVG